MNYVLDAYDEALENILKNGTRKSNRTGIDTLSIFGVQSRYRIDTHFPLLTKRRVWPKAIFAELIWFLSGSTNNKDLQNLGSNIWTPWVNNEFEKKHGYDEGEFGPIYGFQLRHFGGDYGCYDAGGVDQLKNMVDLLRKDPHSRRNLFSLWNPRDINQQVLPCCHYSFQVSVDENGLSGMLTQRSADMFIGSCANIQFYSALLYMLGQQTGYKPYELIHSIGDAHLYEPHLKATEEYLSRSKSDSPKLELNKKNDILEYKLDDFQIKEYYPSGAIKVDVMV